MNINMADQSQIIHCGFNDFDVLTEAIRTWDTGHLLFLHLSLPL